jgi:signal transduction histidine kinase
MLTATGLVLLYVTAGILVAGSTAFELQRFVARSGHLVILSALLIWFGIHQQFTRLLFPTDRLDRRGSRPDSPLAHALAFAMDAAGARSGALLLFARDKRQVAGIRMSDEGISPVKLKRRPSREAPPVVLFDLRRDRCLTRDANGWLEFGDAGKYLDVKSMEELAATDGLIAQLRTGAAPGWLVLWDVSNLSADYVELGVELARAAASALDHEALLAATEEGAAARTRLSLARDVHDSVVQFLAGTAFRVEAIVREAPPGSQVEADLQELKRLLIEEQGEIRAFVSALRRDRELDFPEAAQELKALAARLAQQWAVDCDLVAGDDDLPIPIRLQLDLQQLLREAVANAVRHGGATKIAVKLGADEGQLRMEVSDNGSGIVVPTGESPIQPWSLKERVERAEGSLLLVSEPGRTNIVITIPLPGGAS